MRERRLLSTEALEARSGANAKISNAVVAA
jgi:hypothetical protein